MADEPESERTEDDDAEEASEPERTEDPERAAETATNAASDDSGSTETDDEAEQADDVTDAPEAEDADESPGSDDGDEISDDDSSDSDGDGGDADADGDDADATEADPDVDISDDGDDESGDDGPESATERDDTDDEDEAEDEDEGEGEAGGSLQKVSSDRGGDEERPPDAADEADVDTGTGDGAADGSADAEANADDDEKGSDDDEEPGDDDESDHEYVEDASIDDDFPVAGMSAEDAAWDPEESTSAEELGLEEEEVEPLDDEQQTEPVGVQPEKQEIDDSIWGEGPESDQEMPLADHIEEMMRRLGVVFVIGGAVTLVVLGLAQTVEWLPTAVDIIDALWNHNIPGAPENAGRRPRVYGPLELVLTKLKVAGLAGVLVGLPAFVYETYLFMRPGLYPRERKYYLAAVPTSLILAVIGMTFAHFVVLPVIFDYFTSYTEGTATIAFGLAETFNLIILLMGYMAVVFQIPLFIMLAIMMNLVTRIWLEDKRLLFWGAFAGLAFLVSPDPTGMAPIIIAATMIVLYEGTLALLRWTGN